MSKAATKFVVTDPSYLPVGVVMKLCSFHRVVDNKVFYTYYDEFWGKEKSFEIGAIEVSDQLLKEWLKNEVVGYEEAIAILVELGEEPFFAQGRVDYTVNEIQYPWLH